MNVLFLLTTAEREQVGRPTILNPRNSTPETIASTRCATLYLLTYNIPIKFSIVPFTHTHTLQFRSKSSERRVLSSLQTLRMGKLFDSRKMLFVLFSTVVEKFK